MNPAQEFAIKLIKEKISYYKFLVKDLRYSENVIFYERMLESYKEVLENYMNHMKQ